MSTSNQYVKYHISIYQNSQNVSNNTSYVTVDVFFYRNNSGYQTYGTGNVYCKINGSQYSSSVSSSQKITNSGILLFQWQGNISHNSDGAKTLATSAWINIDTPLTSSEQSFSYTLSTIPRASSFSGGSGNIGQTTTIYISRASSNFGHKLFYDVGSGWVQFALNIQTSLNWTIPTSFYSKIPNSNAGTGSLKCETYNGSDYIGSNTIGFSYYVTGSNPTFSSSQLSYYDNNSTVTNITQNNQLIVQNQSQLYISFTSATAVNSASISSYQIIFNGQTQSKSSSGTYSLGIVNSSQNLTLQIKAIDSRGNSATISKTVTCIGWQVPQLSYQIARVNNFETTTNILANVSISSVNSKNSLQFLQYRTKPTTDSSWSDWIDIPNNTQTQADFDNTKAFNFQIQAQDKFATSTISYILNKGQPIMFFDTEKISIGINKFPINSNSLDVDIINGNPTLTYSVKSSWPGYTIDFNNTYYFTYSNGTFTSNNQSKDSTTAYTRLKIDATDWSTDSTLIVNYTISSEQGYDFGYVTANNSATFVDYNVTSGRFIYASGATTTSNSTYVLAKGKIWYIHLGYRKDGSQSSYNDTFIVNDITF
jgi:hypothetical protein